MDLGGHGHPNGSIFSPPSDLAGPSRPRSLRGSARKPYARPPANGISTPLAGSPLRQRGPSPPPEEEQPSPLASKTPPATLPPRSGLFSTLTKAISKPLSWLSSSSSTSASSASSYPSAQSGNKSILPSSASTGSLADLAKRRAATRANASPEYNRGRLGRLRGKDSYLSSLESGDIESHPTTSNLHTQSTLRSSAAGFGGLSSSASMSALASAGSDESLHSRNGMRPPLAAASHSAGTHRTLTIARPTWRGDISDDFAPRDAAPPSPTSSTASVALGAHGRQQSLHHFPSLQQLAANQSTPISRRGASVAPSESSSVRAGNFREDLNSSPGYSYGFGSERRLGGLSSGNLASRSALRSAGALASSPSLSHLPSRIPPFATAMATPEGALRRSGSLMGRSSLGMYAHSEVGAGGSAGSPSRLFEPATPSRTAVSIIGSANARRSPALSRSGSTLGLSSRTRPWSTLNLAPPRGRPSEGEEVLKDLASARRLGTPNASAAPSVAGGRDSRANTPTSVRLGKRDASDALELGGGFGALDLQDKGSTAGSVSGSARKKQMVWDPEMGFISVDDLRAREPPATVPQNEAERILSVLEGMRTPLRDARKESATGNKTRSGPNTPSRLTQSISVPLPSPSAARAAQNTPDTRRSTRTASKLNQSTPARAQAEEEEGMRAKLRRTARATPTTITTRGQRRRGKGEKDSDDEDAVVQGEDGDSDEMEEREPTPPRRVTRGMARAKGRDDVLSPPPPTRSNKAAANKASVTKTATPAKSPARRSRRGKAASPSPPPADEEMKQDDEDQQEGEAPEPQKVRKEPATTVPSSEEGQNRPKSKFQVLTTADATASRARSSLRQGIVKTSRTHGKSGKISAWDSDEEGGVADDDADMAGIEVGELKKIELPKNFFPEGFKFGSATQPGKPASTTPAVADEKASNQSEETAQNVTTVSEPKELTIAGSSLLNRLGGFAPPVTSTTPLKSPPSKPSAPFSFLPPATSGASSSKPAFSFGSLPQPAPPQPAQSSEGAKKPTPAPSDFFATPPTAPSSSTKTDEAPKKGGPIPNFFGSANKPAETGSLGDPVRSEVKAPFTFAPPPAVEKSASSSPAPAFSFSKPTEEPKATFTPASGSTLSAGFSFGPPATNTSSKPASDGAPSKKIPNFFGGAAATKDDETRAVAASPASSSTLALPDSVTAGKATPFSFGGFGAAKTANTGEKVESTPSTIGGSFSFSDPAGVSSTTSNKDALGPSAAPSKHPFGTFQGFGAAPATSSSSGQKQKRGADDEADSTVEPASKKSVGFTFGSATSTPSSVPANGSSSGVKFGVPPATISTATSEGSKSVSPAPFSFGSNTDASKAKADTGPSLNSGGFSFGPSSTSSAVDGSVSPAPSGASFTFGQPSGGAASVTTSSGPKPFSFGAPTTPAQSSGTTIDNGASSSNDMMDDTSPSQNFNQGNQAGQTSSGGFGFGFGASNKPVSGTSSTGGFSFGSPASSSSNLPGATSSGFTFGGNNREATSTAPSLSFGAPPRSSTTPAFGATTGASGPSTPTATPGGFTFGTPSGGGAGGVSTLPASPGGINFSFGAQNTGAEGSSSTASTGNAPFVFGGGGQTNGGNGNTSSTGGMFHFGSAGPSTPSGNPTGGTFQFGTPGGGAAAALPGAPPQPSAPLQNQPVLFNIGAGGAAPGGPSAGPGGRQLKGLPRSRRR